MPMRWNGLRAGLVLLALAGCGETPNARLPLACPTPGLLGEGADMTRYAPGPVRDLTTLDWEARLIGLSGGCARGRDRRSIDLTLTAGFQVERGPASDARSVDLPWFVAVIDARTEQVLSRQLFLERVVFARNEVRVNGVSEAVTVNLPVTEARKPKDYRILVSFQLTEADLALNRQRSGR